MPRRDYKAEYRRRIERGLARGLSRSQARGHPKASEQPVDRRQARGDSRIDAAILAMNQGRSLTAAARAEHVSPDRLKRTLVQRKIGKRQGQRWIVSDTRPRRVPVLTRGKQKTLILDGFAEGSLAGAHYQAAGEFVRTNDPTLMDPYIGLSVRTSGGQRHPLETDLNELHRIAAMDEPPFHEIYQITSTD